MFIRTSVCWLICTPTLPTISVNEAPLYATKDHDTANCRRESVMRRHVLPISAGSLRESPFVRCRFAKGHLSGADEGGGPCCFHALGIAPSPCVLLACCLFVGCVIYTWPRTSPEPCLILEAVISNTTVASKLGRMNYAAHVQGYKYENLPFALPSPVHVIHANGIKASLVMLSSAAKYCSSAP